MAGRMAIRLCTTLGDPLPFDTLTATSELSPQLWALVALLVGVALRVSRHPRLRDMGALDHELPL